MEFALILKMHIIKEIQLKSGGTADDAKADLELAATIFMSQVKEADLVVGKRFQRTKTVGGVRVIFSIYGTRHKWSDDRPCVFTNIRGLSLTERSVLEVKRYGPKKAKRIEFIAACKSLDDRIKRLDVQTALHQVESQVI